MTRLSLQQVAKSVWWITCVGPVGVAIYATSFTHSWHLIKGSRIYQATAGSGDDAM